jgi:hypothetical protein
MTLLLAALLLAQPADDALRAIEQEQARAKGKQEKGIEAIERALKAPPKQCSRPEPCPPCKLTEDDKVEARVEAVVEPEAVTGIVSLWRLDPPPPVQLVWDAFKVPLPAPEPVQAESKGLPAGLIVVLVAGSAVLGFVAGALAVSL